MRNLTVIEFSNKILRSIDLTVLFINLQAKFIKENRRFTLYKLVTCEGKRKIKGKLIEIEKVKKNGTVLYCYSQIQLRLHFQTLIFKN
jgi:hypothetical protein